VALRTWTVREALEGAVQRLALVAVHPALSAANQALVGEVIQADNLALGALRLDNTIPPGQRGARANQIVDKVRASLTVEAVHGRTVGVAIFYTGLELSDDAAETIRAGLPSFASDAD